MTGLSIHLALPAMADGILRLGASGSDPTLWYLTRAAAVTAYALLALSAILGLLRSLVRSTRLRAGRLIWLLDEGHQFAALLTAAFVALHLGTLVLDPFLPFSLGNLLVPAGEPYRPLATDLGVLTLYALVIVLVSSWLRGRLAYSFWRKLHFLSFVAFVLVTGHGLLAGSDTGRPWMSTIYLAATGLVGTLSLLRLVLRPAQPEATALGGLRR